MDRTGRGARSTRRGPWTGPLMAVVTAFVVAIALEGCGTTSPSAASMTTPVPVAAAPAAMPTAGAGMAQDAAAGLAAIWAARPAFVNTSAETEEAYAYAFHNPQIVQWMPCYCGCARMDHRSNLDCYLKGGVPGQGAQFEEHASYCDICVKITLETKQLIAQGKSLREVRQAVDEAFGGQVAGTPTQLPPA